MSNGNQSKDPLGDIRREIAAAASRSQTALTLIDAVIAEGRDPSEDNALTVAVDVAESHMKTAGHGIRTYRAL